MEAATSMAALEYMTLGRRTIKTLFSSFKKQLSAKTNQRCSFVVETSW